jgi:hypothetical protein
MRKEMEKPAHRNQIIERHLNYQRGVESVWYKYKIQRGVTAMCEGLCVRSAERGWIERRGSPQDSEASIRAFREIGFWPCHRKSSSNCLYESFLSIRITK